MRVVFPKETIEVNDADGNRYFIYVENDDGSATVQRKTFDNIDIDETPVVYRHSWWQDIALLVPLFLAAGFIYFIGMGKGWW
jgi:hypothetical protein